jgi:hypothetical protein
VQREEEASKSKGRAILKAAERMRSDPSNERPLPEKGSLAAQVILAGKKRRGEI